MPTRPRPARGAHRHGSRWARLRAGGERGGGSMSLMLVVLVPALLLMTGLVVDAGGKAQAISRAYAVAEEAARAGTTAVDVAAVGEGGSQVIDPAAATAQARSYLTSTGVTGTARVVDGQRLEVQVTITEPTVFLGIIGVDAWTVTGSGTAELLRT